MVTPEQNEIMFAACRRRNDCSNEIDAHAEDNFNNLCICLTW